jgi:hypothetical protein
MREHDRFVVAVWVAGEQPERPTLFVADAAFACVHHHCTPVRLSRSDFSSQFGRASAPMIPHLVHTIRGPNTGTRTSSGQRSALKIASWLHETSHRE